MPRGTKENIKKKNTTRKTKKKENKIDRETKDNKFSFDEEIVIGLKRLDEPINIKTKGNKKNNKKENIKKLKNNKNVNKKNNNNEHVNQNKKTTIDNEDNIIIKSKYMQNYDESNEKAKYKTNNKNKKNIQKEKNNKGNIKNQNSKKKAMTEQEIKKQEKSRKKRKKVLKIIKWLTLLTIIIGGTVYALLSPIFNVKEIEVVGNSKISSETIISLSEINIDQNMFSFRTSDSKEKIKQNAYIDTVAIHRNLPDKISIEVTERKATYMIKFGNAYAYINNQGYILEITNEKVELPTLIGYETSDEKIQEGNRLDTTDLDKLNDVLKIMEAASNSIQKLTTLINKIDISDKTNYILYLDKEKKQIYFGDITNLSTKILWIDQVLKEEKKNEGVLYLNMDLNKEKPYFREKV